MYNGHKVIDVHGHLSATPELQAYGHDIANSASRQGRPLVLPEGPMRKAQEHHIGYIDERNIDVQLISPRPFGSMHWERPKIVELYTSATNDAIQQACRMYPDRFVGVCQLPQQTQLSPTNCFAEFERCVKDLGFVGAMVNPDPGGDRQTPGMDQDYWFPLYEKSVELNATLFIHGCSCRDPRTQEVQYAMLTESSLATYLLERSDVFERFPGLRIMVAHCGGAPSRFLTRSISAAALPESGLPEGLYFDTCAYEKDYLSLAFKQRGLERFCFGTEAPGAGGALNPETGKKSDDLLPVFDSMKELSDADKRRMYQDNPRKVFPLLRL